MKDFDMFKTEKRHYPPLLALHGFMGHGKDWVEILDLLRYPGKTFIPDLPYHGKSKLKGKNASDLIRAFGNWVWQELNEAPIVLGYSMGGRIALELSHHFPMHALILESTSFGLRTEEEKKKKKFKDGEWSTWLKLKWGFSYLHDWYDQPIFTGIRDDRDRYEILVKKILDHQDPEKLNHALEIFSSSLLPHQWEWAKTLKMPILYTVGEKDKKYMTQGDEIKKECPNIAIEIIPNSSHVTHFQNPNLFAKILFQFISNTLGDKKHESMGTRDST